ncbi:MAG: hypothetical protein MRJ92_07900 [Nitrospira sp.]|nr:hypothetical protein [Nitrospira sp.]
MVKQIDRLSRQPGGIRSVWSSDAIKALYDDAILFAHATRRLRTAGSDLLTKADAITYFDARVPPAS